jgi:hypothetical protein
VKDGEVDFQTNEAVVERLAEADKDSISALGSIGEFSRLTGSEHRRFAEAVVELIYWRCEMKPSLSIWSPSRGQSGYIPASATPRCSPA